MQQNLLEIRATFSNFEKLLLIPLLLNLTNIGTSSIPVLQFA